MTKLILSIVFFALTLYLVEVSPIGSSSVAKYNEGYGTFDMKKYDTKTVKTVLGKMKPKGFTVYKWYYLADTIFLVAFGILQLLLLKMVFSWMEHPALFFLLCAVPILRGMADMLENIILCTTLFQYPTIHDIWIHVSSVATTVKLILIRVWVGTMLVGGIGQIVTRLRA